MDHILATNLDSGMKIGNGQAVGATDPVTGETVATELRRLMAQGALPPGIHLRQEELATRFQVSRSPIREALKLLVAEGSVKHDRNRGFFVAPLDTSEMEQLYLLRRLVETEVLRTVRWPNAAELRAMNKFVEGMIRAAKQEDYARFAGEHRSLHFSVYDLSPKKVFVKEAKDLWALTDRYRALLVPELGVGRVGKDEKRLVQALTEQDSKSLLGHFEEGRDSSEKMLLRLMTVRGL